MLLSGKNVANITGCSFCSIGKQIVNHAFLIYEKRIIFFPTLLSGTILEYNLAARLLKKYGHVNCKKVLELFKNAFLYRCSSRRNTETKTWAHLSARITGILLNQNIFR